MGIVSFLRRGWRIDMQKLSKEAKASWCLFVVCWLVYAIVSMTKSAFSASIASIVSEGILNKADAGVINACFYLFYGGAQLVFLKAVDKISPIKLITMTLLGTLASLIGMALSTSFLPMLIWWSFCGLMQFAIWPAVLRLMSEYLLPEHEGFAHIAIAFSYCVGSLLNYLLAALLLAVGRWQLLFWSFAGIVGAFLLVWFIVAGKTVPVLTAFRKPQVLETAAVLQEKPADNGGLFKILLSSGLVFLLITGFSRTALDAGLKSWVPTMIVENYKDTVSISFANVLTTVLICVNLTGAFIATFIYPKRIKSAVWALSACFLSVVPFMVLLLWTGKIAVALVVLSLTVITTMMYAGHQLINVIIPSRFSKLGKEGSVCAILNAFASFGAVAANFCFGFLAEHYGWTATTASWIVIAMLAFLFTALAAPKWKRFFRERGEAL